jgi:hypothetical protein
MTLREGRRNFQYFGACDYRMRKSVLPPAARNRYRHGPRTEQVASIRVGRIAGLVNPAQKSYA